MVASIVGQLIIETFLDLKVNSAIFCIDTNLQKLQGHQEGRMCNPHGEYFQSKQNRNFF